MTLDNDVKLALTNFKNAVVSKAQSLVDAHNISQEAHSDIRTAINNKADNNHTHSYNNLSDKPTNVSDFNNDAGYITSSDIPDDLSDFNNDTNFITISDVSQAGYITDSAITTHNSDNSAHATLFSSKADTIHTHSDWTPVPHNFDDVTILKNEALRMISFKCYRTGQKFPLPTGTVPDTTNDSYLPYTSNGTGAGYVPSGYRPVGGVVGGCFNPKLTFAINSDGRIIIHFLEKHTDADWAINFSCFYTY